MKTAVLVCAIAAVLASTAVKAAQIRFLHITTIKKFGFEKP